MKDDQDESLDILEIDRQAREAAYLRLFRNSLFVAVVLFALAGSVSNFSDDSVLSYSCPAAGTVDAPVELVRLESVKDGLQHTNLVKGFARRMVRWMHPRSPREAEAFYPLVARHSVGRLKMDYLARVEDMKKVKSVLDQGRYVALYPLNESEIAIRKVEGESRWIIRFEANRVKREGNRSFGRTRVDVTMSVVREETDIDGSWSGFYLESVKYETQTDAVAGNKEEVK